ncbi:MAG TPA: PQQ-binding-like beta-propeller repeat protein [Candidatus Polarisedimenticolia bacterium]|jgi:outer membrane protein assembly factor BamB
MAAAFVAVTATLAALGPTGGAPAPPGLERGAGEWPSFRGDPQLTGVARGDLSRLPDVLWTFQAGGGIESTPAVQGGAVYFGAMDGFLYSLSVESGALRWKYAAAGPIKSSPLVYGGTVYFGDETGAFHAVDARGGIRRWVFQTGSAVVSSATQLGGRIIFGSNDNHLYGLSAADGSLAWKLETGGYVYSSPAVTDRFEAPAVVSAGCDGFLRVVRARDGAEIKKIELGAYVGASPALREGLAFVGTFENQFLAVDLAAGKVIWRYEHPERKFPFYGSAAVAGRMVVVGGRDRFVHALDSGTGASIWTWTAGAKVDASPVIVKDRVIAATAGGDVVVLGLESGEPLWKFETGSAIAGSPALSAGRLFIGTGSGTLYAFGDKK